MWHFTDLRFAVPIFSWFADLYFLIKWFFGPKFFFRSQHFDHDDSKKGFSKKIMISVSTFKGLLSMPVSAVAYHAMTTFFAIPIACL